MNVESSFISEKRALSALDIGDEVGPFLIIKVLSRNDFGATYLSRHSVSGKKSIVKTFPPGLENDTGFVQRFQLTREKLINFKHYNVLATKQLEFDGVEPYAVLEYLVGKDELKTLKMLFEERKKFSDSQCVRMALSLCSALSYAHACRGGIVHCNLKPSNILISNTGSPLISEFGLFNLLGQQRLGLLLDKAKTMKEAFPSGYETYEYMSPEQRDGRVINTQSNIYSFGLILYRALTGKMYDPTVRMDVSAKWRRILMRALEVNPEKRYKQIDEMSYDIRRAFLTYRFLLKIFFSIVIFCAVIWSMIYGVTTLSDITPQLNIAFIKERSKFSPDHSLTQLPGTYVHFYQPPPLASTVKKKIVPVERSQWKIDDLDMVFQSVETDSKYYLDMKNIRHFFDNPQTFWILSTEVTQAQFLSLMKYDPSSYRDRNGRMPVHHVSYQEAMMFCERLTQREQDHFRLSKSLIYTLPTYEQWFYATHISTDTPYALNPRILWPESSWLNHNSGKHPHKVGELISTFGYLYDVFGNVQEWVLPLKNSTGKSYACGFGFQDSISRLFETCLWAYPENTCSDNIGFRIILRPK